MIEWSTPEGHFATATVGAVTVAVVRREGDQAAVVFYLGSRVLSRHDTAEEARAHVEQYVEHWIRSAGLMKAPERLASAA